MAASLREVLCFGRYEPLFRVAAGGMAEVYAAHIQGEAGFQKLVAVKRMLPHLATEAGFVDMFLNEAKLAAHVASPHVVQTLDLGRGSDGSLYIVMELVVGLSLARMAELRPGAMPIQIAVEILAQTAQGLDDAHEATTPAGDPLGLIHRDVSPHNILIGIDGRVRVTDFGIARAVFRPRPETNIRELKGKFAYMSPEQTRLKNLDRRSDVFSLGTTLWESLTGDRLFAHRDPIEAVRLVQKKPVNAPHGKRPEVPVAISLAVMRALERDPERRWQTAGELATELRRAAREAYGEPPTKKEIAAFIEDAGGDELKRLQRLIRLGTEGAAPEAIEAVQPGATKVLAEDASGVARVGTGARRTAVLDDEDEEEESEGPPTLLIATENTPVDTEPPSGDIPTEIFEDPTANDETLERTGFVENPEETRTVATTTDEAQVAPSFATQPPPSPSITPITIVALFGVAVALFIGIAVALAVFWPSEPEMVVLPLQRDPIRVEPPPIVTTQIPPIVMNEPPPPIIEPPAPVIEEPVIEPVAIETPVEEPPSRRPSRPPHRVRVVERPQPVAHPIEPPPRERTPVLMGVQDFDRRQRGN